MATATLVPLSEYLNTTYHPDCDFLEGELEERNMGEQPHSRIQGYFIFLFRSHREKWQVRTLPEQRVQVGAERFRIPDVSVVPLSDPPDAILKRPPLLCIEVLSSCDSLRSLQQRITDYLGMGVQHIWVIDPWSRLGYVADSHGYHQPEDGILRISGTPIEVSLAQVFAELDEDLPLQTADE